MLQKFQELYLPWIQARSERLLCEDEFGKGMKLLKYPHGFYHFIMLQKFMISKSTFIPYSFAMSVAENKKCFTKFHRSGRSAMFTTTIRMANW